MLRLGSRLAIAATALAAGCGPPRAAIRPPAVPERPSTPSRAWPARLNLIVEAKGAAPAPPPEEVTAILPDRFVAVPLPPGTAAVVSVAGRADRDVWLLTTSGSVLQWNGEAMTSRGTPRCWADTCCGTLVDCAKTPGACTEAASESCPSQAGAVCAKPVYFSDLRSSPADLFARAFVDTGGLRQSVVDARWDRGKHWSCEQASDDLLRPDVDGRGDSGGANGVVLDGSSLRFEGPAHLVNALGGHSLTIDGRRVPVPAGYGMTGRYGLFAAARDDLWLWSYYRPIPDGDETLLFHGNGLMWDPVATDLETIEEIWGDGARRVWVLGQNKAGTYLLRRERDGWARFTMPSDWFADGQLTASVMSGSAGDFWVVGASAFVYWDGAKLFRVNAPLDLRDSWRSPSGELWVVGARRGAGPDGKDAGQQGAVFRWVPRRTDGVQ